MRRRRRVVREKYRDHVPVFAAFGAALKELDDEFRSEPIDRDAEERQWRAVWGETP